MQTRRDFLKTGMLSTAGLALAGMGVPLRSFARTLGANDRVRVGVIGFSDRFRSSLLPTFMANAKELNFEIVAVSDIWKLRREEAVKHFKEKYNLDVKAFRNNERLSATTKNCMMPRFAMPSSSPPPTSSTLSTVSKL